MKKWERQRGGNRKMMEEAAEIQNILDNSGFYMIDTKIEEVAKGLGLGYRF